MMFTYIVSICVFISFEKFIFQEAETRIMRAKTIILTLTLLMLTACQAYNIQISDVVFDHSHSTGKDIIKYTVANPSEEDLECEVTIEFEGADSVIEEFNIDAYQEKNISTQATIPTGKTNVALNSRCKPTQ